MVVHSLNIPKITDASIIQAGQTAVSTVLTTALSGVLDRTVPIDSTPERREWESEPRIAFRPHGLAERGEFRAYLSVAKAVSPNSPIGNVLDGARGGTYKYPGGRSHETHGYYYMDFLVQSFGRAQHEKVQITDTFGEDYVRFFGKKPLVLGITAVLLTGRYTWWDVNGNSYDTVVDWESEWWHNFEEVLRGTRLVEEGRIATFAIEEAQFHGHVLHSETSRSAQEPKSCVLQFTFLVKDIIPVNFRQVIPLPETLTPDFLDGNSLRRVEISEDLDVTNYLLGELAQVGANVLNSSLEAAGVPVTQSPASPYRVGNALDKTGKTMQNNAIVLKAKVEDIYLGDDADDETVNEILAKTMLTKTVDVLFT